MGHRRTVGRAQCDVRGAMALVCLHRWGGVGCVCQDGKGPVIAPGTQISGPRVSAIWGHMVYEGTDTHTETDGAICQNQL